MKKITFVFLALICFKSFSQSFNLKGWHLLDYEKDSVAGISLNKAYQFLKTKNISPKNIIVAVIDAGTDTLHEDLKSVLWRNTKEIPNNKIDDDKNGYIDDFFGWNFLGNSNGENILTATKETIRFYHKYKAKFQDIGLENNVKLSDKELYQFKVWKRAEKLIKPNREKELEVTIIKMALNNMKSCSKELLVSMGKEDFTVVELEKFIPSDGKAKANKQNYLTNILMLGIDSDEKNSGILTQLEEQLKILEQEVKGKEILPIEERTKLLKEDYQNFNYNNYGNGNVGGKNPEHGTHVAGIIAADRTNNLGVEGVAINARILTIRAVPDGDEYDKDIALGIIYAVNKGAKVINMSFGKEISPEKFWVDSAFKYAAKNDVLLVHAAGNETENIDSVESYPSAKLLDGTKALNVITVGASSDPKVLAGGYVADFSNYGKNEVDVFAPGVKIYSTMPGINQYAFQKGTSMAAPIVSGLAALIRGSFPNLTAVETKEIIEQSVYSPNEDGLSSKSFMGINIETVLLKDACKSKGIVNAANAIELAWKISINKK